MLYSDMFDTEGLISSAWGDGRVEDILTVINAYEEDYPNLIKHSDSYPTPDYLRSITRQGAIDIAPYKGYTDSTPGSRLIIDCAKKADDRPLYILAWGLLEDIAQALHDAPEIIDKIRVNYIAGPNKKWGLNAYEYILREFPDLWIIEDNSTYRGWFNGGNMEGDLGNQSFVLEHAKGHGALGDFFATQLGSVIKMGDTPTVTWLFDGNPEDPEKDSLGGRFERVWNRPHRTYHRNTTKEDVVEIFEVIEFVFDGYYCGNGEYKVRFMPKSLGEWEYVLESDIPELNGQSGQFISVPEVSENRKDKGQNLKNWWADTLEPEAAEGVHMGTKTVNCYREFYLRDFAVRFDRCL